MSMRLYRNPPRPAVDAFMADRSEVPIPMPDKSGSVVIVKQ